MALRVRVAIGILALAALSGAIVIGGWFGSDDDGPARPVEWKVERQLGPKQARLSAPIEYCSAEPPRLERPIVEYSGNRAFIELRRTPEELKEGQNGCLLRLLVAYKTITLERNLNELTLFDSSTDPPERRWPRAALPDE
jgi:hypothetical protein